MILVKASGRGLKKPLEANVCSLVGWITYALSTFRES